ncbi:unnamed protein product [Trichobilharzia regenti]|nr:unnamed protein product [Trichobilharzia regenti]
MHCGSTIGPLLSSQLGIPTVDLGFPQLAMHSCRELCCTSSVEQAVRLYSAYYENLSKIWYCCNNNHNNDNNNNDNMNTDEEQKQSSSQSLTMSMD